MGKVFKLSASQAGQLAALSGANALGYVTPGSREATRLAALNDSAQGIVAAEAARKAAKDAEPSGFEKVLGVAERGVGLAGSVMGLSSMGSGATPVPSISSAVPSAGDGGAFNVAATPTNPFGQGAPQPVGTNTVLSAAQPAMVGANTVLADTPTAPSAPSPTPGIGGALAVGAGLIGAAGMANKARATQLSAQGPHADLVGGPTTRTGPLQTIHPTEEISTDPAKAMQYVQTLATSGQQIPGNVWQTLPREVKQYVKGNPQYKDIVPGLGDRILWAMPGAQRQMGQQPNGDFYF